jgi:hypothetical protein
VDGPSCSKSTRRVVGIEGFSDREYTGRKPRIPEGTATSFVRDLHQLLCTGIAPSP